MFWDVLQEWGCLYQFEQMSFCCSQLNIGWIGFANHWILFLCKFYTALHPHSDQMGLSSVYFPFTPTATCHRHVNMYCGHCVQAQEQQGYNWCLTTSETDCYITSPLPIHSKRSMWSKHSALISAISKGGNECPVFTLFIPVSVWRCRERWPPGLWCLGCCGRSRPQPWLQHHKVGAQAGGHAPDEWMKHPSWKRHKTPTVVLHITPACFLKITHWGSIIPPMFGSV